MFRRPHQTFSHSQHTLGGVQSASGSQNTVPMVERIGCRLFGKVSWTYIKGMTCVFMSASSAALAIGAPVESNTATAAFGAFAVMFLGGAILFGFELFDLFEEKAGETTGANGLRAPVVVPHNGSINHGE